MKDLKGKVERLSGEYWLENAKILEIGEILDYSIVIGADEMSKNPILSSDQGQQLFEMHNLGSSPSVQGNVRLRDSDGKYMEDRWKAREGWGAGDHFAAYFHKNGKVRSMISGTIKNDGNIYFINNMTRPEFRLKGYSKALIALTAGFFANKLPECNVDVENVHAVFGLGKDVGPRSKYSLDNRDIEAINERSRVANDPEDEKSKRYGKVMGKSIEAIKKHYDQNVSAEGVTSLYGDIPETPRDVVSKYGKFIERMKDYDIDHHPDIATGISTNLSPYVKVGIPEVRNKVSDATRKIASEFALNRQKSFKEKYEEQKTSSQGAVYVGFGASGK